MKAWGTLGAAIMMAACIGISSGHAQAPVAPSRDVSAGFADLVEKLTPTVVNISTTQKLKGKRLAMQDLPLDAFPPGSPFEEFREFFERSVPEREGERALPQQKAYSLGSGFIIDPSGFIVTNQHVISDAEEITVVLSDNRKFPAKIIGRDSKTDLALLKIEAGKPLPAAVMGDSEKVRVGDWVIAIGNPFGLGGTVTAGIISARARDIHAGPFDDFLQTDAAINRGNSGGPMFNAKGEVIGINSAIFSPSGTNIGIGFAVPSDLAKPVIQQLKEQGHTTRGWLGVKIQGVTEDMAESMGLTEGSGALVVEVTKDGPAEKAGIKDGDVILGFDGKDVKEMRRLPRIVAETPIGKKAPVTLWRAGKKKELAVTVGKLDEKDEALEENEDQEPKKKEIAGTQQWQGLKLAGLTSELRDEYGIEKNVTGLLVVEVAHGSEAEKREVLEGDVITRVNEEKISNYKEFEDALNQAKTQGRKFAMLRILRAGEPIFITMPTK